MPGIATANATLRLHMLAPRRARKLVYPFNCTDVQYFYLARNAICWLTRQWLRAEEVLFPAYFHGVEFEALIRGGGKPCFYGVSGNMRVDLEDICRRVSARTRAIYLIHYLGFPGPVEELVDVCRRRGILLIEDCALALLSRLGDRPLGSYGDAAVYCLYKTLPVPNGGVLVLNNRSKDLPVARTVAPPLTSTAAYVTASLGLSFKTDGQSRTQTLVKMLRNLGKSVSTALGHKCIPVGDDHFQAAHAQFGMSALSRVIAASQDFESIIAVRRRNYLHLLRRLRELSPPIFDGLPCGVCPLSYPIRNERKKEAVGRLAARGIHAIDFWSQHHPALPAGEFREVDELRRTILELPCHQDLSPETIDWIADQVFEVWREVGTAPLA